MTRILVAFALASLGLAVAPGCSSTQNAPPRVALYSTVGDSTAHPQNECKLAPTDWLDIGAIGATTAGAGDQAIPINDGDVDSASGTAATGLGHTVHVSQCSVVASNGGYDVSVAVDVDNVGSFSVSGHFTGDGTQNNVHAVFSRADTGGFVEDDCTVDYTTADTNTGHPGIAPGRVWGQLKCPNATYEAQSRTCAGFAEFRFENCAQ